jgi:hypothetical protein
MSKLDHKSLQMLVCPLTKTALTYDKDKQELISRAARLAFPIHNNIPLLYIDESRELTNEEYDILK